MGRTLAYAKRDPEGRGVTGTGITGKPEPLAEPDFLVLETARKGLLVRMRKRRRDVDGLHY